MLKSRKAFISGTSEESRFLCNSFLMDFTHIFLLQKWKNVVIMSAVPD